MRSVEMVFRRAEYPVVRRATQPVQRSPLARQPVPAPAKRQKNDSIYAKESSRSLGMHKLNSQCTSLFGRHTTRRLLEPHYFDGHSRHFVARGFSSACSFS